MRPGGLQIELDTRAISELRWNGTPLRGRSILLLAEQGIGDQVMFASCLPDILQQAANCFVECDARLVPLFARSFPQITARRKDARSGSGARSVPVPSSNISGPCLAFCDGESRTFRRAVFSPAGSDPGRQMAVVACAPGGALKSAFPGKVDATRKRVAGGRFRSPVGADLPGAGRTIRQSSIRSGGRRRRRGPATFRDSLDDGTDCDPLLDLDDFAAKIAALDLVISVDNSTAHLAAAIGQKVWTLLPFAPDWRWMLDRETTPWYPTMRLLRCQGLDQWSELLQRTARRLTAFTFSGGFRHGAARPEIVSSPRPDAIPFTNAVCRR